MTKTGYEFSKILPGGVSWSLGPTGKLFLARGKKKKLDHLAVGYSQLSIPSVACLNLPVVRGYMVRNSVEAVTVGWRKMHNEDLHNLCSSPNTIIVIKANEMRWL
jgi:hypothetical protein